MSIRQKEFEKALQKARNERDSELRLRKLGDTYIRYLKYSNGIYSEAALKSIEKTITKKYQDGSIPPELHLLYLEVAKHYSRVENYDAAISALAEIVDSRNLSVMMQAKYEYEMIKLKQNLEKGTVDTEIIGEIKKIVKDDQDNELETATGGEFSDYDIFCSYFGEKIPISNLSEEIFPVNMEKPKDSRLSSDDVVPGPHVSSSYIEELSANNRLQFLVENFKIESGRPGEGKFTGAILFEIEDSDLVIVESFWKQGKNGEPPVEDYGKATYILPKDQAIDLIQMSRGEIQAKNDPRIRKVSHGSKEYYNNLITRFNEAQSSQLQKIEQQSNPLENAQHSNERENPTTDTIKTQSETAKNSTVETMTNEEFLNLINQNLGGIISPNIMEGLLKRASYSFKDLYEGKLRSEILERLEVLEVPVELQDIEAQKAFLYIRMAKNISMINSGAINGKKLSDILDNSIIEYSEAIKFFEEHSADGLSYTEMKNAMKKYIETGKDSFIKDEAPQLSQENDAEKTESVEETVQNFDISSQLQEEQQDSGEDILGSLLGGEVKKETKTKAIDVVTRYLELLKRNEELDLETERINKQLEEKKKQYEKSQQATQAALEEERKAKLATQAARKQEEASGQEFISAQQEKEKIEDEQKELKDKISKIEEMLR